jgi:hypothetical protein
VDGTPYLHTHAPKPENALRLASSIHQTMDLADLSHSRARCPGPRRRPCTRQSVGPSMSPSRALSPRQGHQRARARSPTLAFSARESDAVRLCERHDRQFILLPRVRGHARTRIESRSPARPGRLIRPERDGTRGTRSRHSSCSPCRPWTARQ